MIYAAKLGMLAKLKFKNLVFQTTVGKIIETLPIDPSISNMDVAVLAAMDFDRKSAAKLREAIDNAHPNVKVLYIYTNAKDKDICSDNAIKKQVKKIAPDTIETLINEVLSSSKVTENLETFVSSDWKDPSADLEKKPSLFAKPEPIPEPEPVIEEPEPVIEEPAPIAEEPVLEVPPIPEPVVEDNKDEEVKNLEERIRQQEEYPDWDLFKRALEKDVIMREVMNENTAYAGAINMLEVLDRQIASIYKSTTMSSEAKLEEIRKIGQDRAAFKATANNALADKVTKVIDAIVETTSVAVDKRIAEIKKGLDVVAGTANMFKKTEKLEMLTRDRLELQNELNELSIQIIETYKLMDATVADIIEQQEEGLPSSNTYINEIMKPVSGLFTPQNAGALASKLMSDLQSNRISLSAIGEKVQELVTLIFRLCDADAATIEHQQKLIELYKAQRVEDVVIVTNVIKNSLRVMMGANNSGVTATALTQAYNHSRTGNTLLVDFRRDSKLSTYGVESMELSEFLLESIEEDFVAVTGTLPNNMEDITELMQEITKKLSHYRFIDFIMDSEDAELLNSIGDYVLSLCYVVDSSKEHIEMCKEAMSKITYDNLARKLAIVGPVVPVTNYIEDTGVDPCITKIVTIPYMDEVKAAALRCEPPYRNTDVRTVYAEAFK